MKSRLMRQRFLITLAFIVGLSSVGQVFEAAFCPRMQGRDCCLAKADRAPQTSDCGHQTAINQTSMGEMSMDDMQMGSVTVETTWPASSLSDETITLDKLDEPIGSCAHCLSHSGLANAPVSFVTGTDQSTQTVPCPAPVPSFQLPSQVNRLNHGLPGQHAPPGASASRYLLINVFLI
jgi:hypothetical protein